MNTKGISKFIYYALKPQELNKNLKPSSFFHNVVKMLFFQNNQTMRLTFVEEGAFGMEEENKIFHADSVGIGKKKRGRGRQRCF